MPPVPTDPTMGHPGRGRHRVWGRSSLSVAEQSPEEGGYERTPPHDIQAEQSVLGGMLLTKDAITQVVEIIHDTDFYRPAHQIIYEAIIDLVSRGDPDRRQRRLLRQDRLRPRDPASPGRGRHPYRTDRLHRGR